MKDLDLIVRKYYENIELPENSFYELQPQSDDFWKALLFRYGDNFYISKDFDFQKFIYDVKNFFSEKSLSFDEVKSSVILFYKVSGGNKVKKMLNLNKEQIFLLYRDDFSLKFMFLDESFYEQPPVQEIDEKGVAGSKSLTASFISFVRDYFRDDKFLNMADENYYVEIQDDRFLGGVNYVMFENEVLLSVLRLLTPYNFLLEESLEKNLKWLFVLTDRDAQLFGIDEKYNLRQHIPLNKREITVKRGIKTTFRTKELEWKTLSANSSKFKDLIPLLLLDADERKVVFTKLLIEKSGSKQKYFDFAKQVALKINNELAKLIVFTIDFWEQKDKIDQEYTRQDLEQIFLPIFDSSETGDNLLIWKKLWHPDLYICIFLVDIMRRIARNKYDLGKIALFYNEVQDEILKNEKDDLNKLYYEIEFAKYNIDIENYDKAQKILRKLLKKIPTDTIEELLYLPGENDTKPIRLIVLELLAKTLKGDEANEVLRQAAVIAPLQKESLKILAESNNYLLSSKSETLLNVLEGSDLQPVEYKVKLQLKSFSTNFFNELKHPALQKKGVFGNLSKWLAKAPPPDVEVIKKYAEKWKPKSYPMLAEVVADLTRIFGLPGIDIFITHGDKNIGLTGFSGKKPIILIGEEHLKNGSSNYLNYSELEYALAVETAYIIYDFVNITSSDIWRGAMEKSVTLINTLIDFIPMANTILKTLEKAEKVAKISSLLEKSLKFREIAGKTNSVLALAAQTLNVLASKTDKKNENQDENLIALSRVMQITADRVALLITNDIVSATRSIFLTSPYLSPMLENAQKNGLNSLLMQKDSNGNLVNKNLAMRFAHLFSYWLSDDYAKMRRKIVRK